MQDRVQNAPLRFPVTAPSCGRPLDDDATVCVLDLSPMPAVVCTPVYRREKIMVLKKP